VQQTFLSVQQTLCRAADNLFRAGGFTDAPVHVIVLSQ
jgi:hypothetical protein